MASGTLGYGNPPRNTATNAAKKMAAKANITRNPPQVMNTTPAHAGVGGV
jgi:hypothetical protein